MISLSDVTVRFGSQVIFEEVSWQLHPGRHYGLVGANGTGKSTLLKLMTGELKPEDGTVSKPNNLRIGVLPQDHFRLDDSPLLEVVLMGKPDLWQALEEKAALLEKAGKNGGEGVEEKEGHRLGELEAIIADNEGYTAETFASTLLEGLGLPAGLHQRPMHKLSGGYRLRVLLAQTLFQEPEFLLLDEPTNHLDILSILWIEDYLRNFSGTLVVVSHDRHFLNSISDHIADLDYQELRLYTGNYDKFIAAKILAEEQKKKEIARAEKKIEEMQQFIDRFKAKATKARQASSRQKQIERVEMPVIKRSSRRFPSFSFKPLRPSGREVVTVKALKKAYSNEKVLKSLNFELRRGEKLAVVGPNGIGKTTLLKILAEELLPDSGEIIMGYEVQTGFFAQDLSDIQKGKASVYDWLTTVSRNKEIGAVRGTLGRVLFSGDEADKPISALSGGEATRLRLAGLMMRGDNLLLLDEPTNHLDLEGREALMKALIAYEGTLIFVSHDRHFVSTVANRVLALTAEGVEDFHGSYEEFLARKGLDYLTAEGAAQLKKPEIFPRKTSPDTPDFQQRKSRKKKAGQMKRKMERLEGRVAGLEKELDQMDQRFSQEGYHQNNSWEEINRDEQDKKKKQQELEKTIADWELAVQNLENLQETG